MSNTYSSLRLSAFRLVVACAVSAALAAPAWSQTLPQSADRDRDDVVDHDRRTVRNWPVAFDEAFLALKPVTDAVPSAASHFVAVVPCRVVDTRNTGSTVPANSTKTIDVAGSGCGIPAGAAAYSLSFTVMVPSDNGYLTAYPAGASRPNTATLSYAYFGGPSFENAAIVPAGVGGAIDVYVVAELHLIVDINGYFAEGVVTNLTAGTGLTGGGTGSVALGIADLGVDTPQLADAAVTDVKLATIAAAGKVSNSATTATSANVADTIVARDATGRFAAGALTLTGKIDQTSVDGFVARGTYNSGTIPATGEGARMMWYPRKAAFRAGWAWDTGWDDASVGPYSVALGLAPIASGFAATAVGNAVIARGANSVALGYFSTASGERSFALGSNASTNGHRGAFVYGDSSGSTVSASVPNEFVARAAGGVRFFSDSAMTLGVALAANGTSWAAISDRNQKEDFQPVDGGAILKNIAALPVTSWRYRNDHSGQRYIGPVAQDFHALFGLGTDTTIATLDVDGVSLAAIKALEARTAELMTQVERLTAANEELRRSIEELKKDDKR